MRARIKQILEFLACVVEKSIRRGTKPSSSISDTPTYREVCAEAAESDVAFSVFRQNPVYTDILEHVSIEQGHAYLEAVQSDSVVTEYVKDFAPRSLRGGPAVADFGFGQEISPTLLRYAKVLVDLRTLFGALDAYRIVEVGVGYGGQCQIVCGVHDIAEYVLIDLPEVLKLAERWIEPYKKSQSMRFVDALSTYSHYESDLFISNYAFSEIQRPQQEALMDAYVSNARRGYVTYNHIGGGRDIIPAVEFAESVQGEIRPEYPLTHKDNCIVIWGH